MAFCSVEKLQPPTRSVDEVGFHALGLSLAEGKAIKCRLQEELTQF
jgi:hypothetical protein